METKKSYSLKSALLFVFLFSFAMVAATWLVAPLLEPFRAMLLPDAGAAWYVWKLPKPELLASISMWVLYLAHQITVWVLIVKLKNDARPEAGRIGKYNLQLLIANAVFIALHLVQTVFFYDALAQFMPVMTSQGSVIVMLVMMLLLLNNRRGLFFGKKVYLPPLGVAATQKIHGFYISWAVVYTFWFHPMEGTLGHLLGFFYLFLLMGQMSLARTTWRNGARRVPISRWASEACSPRSCSASCGSTTPRLVVSPWAMEARWSTSRAGRSKLLLTSRTRRRPGERGTSGVAEWL